ncbi:MAG: hypothetical protein HOO06_12960 [Bdellovibrionaceae bacterium]|jgi:Mrp family chromosome partitioning ATPase/capsular polysaccharide biosynthesis protein|nr:hypothetical protein [Pseudobdellovibrionaceae bacterium]
MDSRGTNTSNNQSSSVMEINFHEMSKYIFTHRYIFLIFVFALPALMGIWGFFIKKPKYKATVEINIGETMEGSSGMGSMFDVFNQSKDKENKLYISEQVFNSNLFMEALYDEVMVKSDLTKDLQDVEEKRRIVRVMLGSKLNNKLEGANELMSYLYLTTDLDRYHITLNSLTPTAKFSSAIVDIASYTLIGLNFKNLVKKLISVEEFLNGQLNQTKQRLTHLEVSLAKVQSENKILSVEQAQKTINAQHLQRLNVLRKAQIEFDSSKKYLDILKFEMADLRMKMLSKKRVSYLYLNQLHKRLDILRFEKESQILSREIASDIHSKKEINVILSKIRSGFNSLDNNEVPSSMSPWEYYTSLEKNSFKLSREITEKAGVLSSLKEDINISSKDFETLPVIMQDISFLKRQVDIMIILYKELQRKLQETQIRRAGQINDLVIFSNSELPLFPSGLSMIKKYFLSFIGGGTIGFIILLLYYLLIPTVRSKDDLEKIGIHVIGEVPFSKWATKQKIISIKQSKELIVLKEIPESYEAHAIRYARFNLERCFDLHVARNEGYGKVITSVSVNTNEGKSFMTANLAYGLSSSKFRTVIVDIDFEEPSAARYFKNLRQDKQFDYISDDNRVEFRLRTENEYLDVIDTPALTKNGCEYLEGIGFRNFIHDLKERYDVIFIDTPPLSEYLEGLIATQYSDGIMFVSNQRQTIVADIEDNYDRITQTFRGPIVGVLNFTYDDINIPFITEKKKRVA